MESNPQILSKRKIIFIMLLVCLLEVAYSKPMETLETIKNLERRETEKVDLANRHWLDVLVKTANSVNWLDVLVELADNINWLEVLVQLAKKRKMSLNSVLRNDYYYSLSDYPTGYQSFSN